MDTLYFVIELQSMYEFKDEKYCLNIRRKAWITRWGGGGIAQAEFPLWTAMHQKQKLDDLCRFNYFSSKSVQLFFPLLTTGSHSFKKRKINFCVCILTIRIQNLEPRFYFIAYTPERSLSGAACVDPPPVGVRLASASEGLKKMGVAQKALYCKNLIPLPPPPPQTVSTRQLESANLNLWYRISPAPRSSWIPFRYVKTCSQLSIPTERVSWDNLFWIWIWVESSRTRHTIS